MEKKARTGRKPLARSAWQFSITKTTSENPMDEKTIRAKVKDHGGTTIFLNNGGWLGKAWLFGYESRDVLVFDVSEGSRTREQQKLADTWRGVPPVDVRKAEDVSALMERIKAGEFEAWSRYHYYQPEHLHKVKVILKERGRG